MKAMILAAGFGKRLLPLTEKVPKPLLPINGKPLIQYHIERLKKADFVELVVNTAHLGQHIEAYCGDGLRFGLHITYSREEKPLDTAGGIYHAMPFLGEEPFAVINADIWTDFDFMRLKRVLLGKHLGHIVLVPNPSHNPEGDFHLDIMTGKLIPDGGNTYTFSGMSVISKQLFETYGVQTGPLAPLLKKAIEDGLISAEVYTGLWYDVGTPERLREVSDKVTSIMGM